jgi:hypothetical protein
MVASSGTWAHFEARGSAGNDDLKKFNSSIWYSIHRRFPVNFTSPYVVVAAIVIVFAVVILFATSSKEDGHEKH